MVRGVDGDCQVSLSWGWGTGALAPLARGVRVSSSWEKVCVRVARMRLLRREREILISMEAGGAGQTTRSKEFV